MLPCALDPELHLLTDSFLRQPGAAPSSGSGLLGVRKMAVPSGEAEHGRCFFRAQYLGEEIPSRNRRGPNYEPVVLGFRMELSPDTGTQALSPGPVWCWRGALAVKAWRAGESHRPSSGGTETPRPHRLASPLPLRRGATGSAHTSYRLRE